ncbi:MAG: radical SAM protein, partial [Hyphomicrobiales bacterium]|nr:radical SAM protein [Hyphomicrobiales bacterium]
EAEKLVAAGVKELLVISQDTSAYGVDVKYAASKWRDREVRAKFIDLASALGELGVWVRLHYVYPYPHVDEVIPLMAERKVLPYLDMPLQHAAPDVLKRMKRPASQEKTLERIARWREICPDLTLRSTFIVGFPGETEEDFSATLALAEEIGFASAYAFKYSARPGTPAAARDGQVDEATKSMRLHRLNALLDATRFAFNRSFVGEALETLFERPGRLAGQLVGRTPHNLAVHVDAPAGLRPGDLRTVEILSAPGNTLSGRVVA